MPGILTCPPAGLMDVVRPRGERDGLDARGAAADHRQGLAADLNARPAPDAQPALGDGAAVPEPGLELNGGDSNDGLDLEHDATDRMAVERPDDMDSILLSAFENKVPTEILGHIIYTHCQRPVNARSPVVCVLCVSRSPSWGNT